MKRRGRSFDMISMALANAGVKNEALTNEDMEKSPSGSTSTDLQVHQGNSGEITIQIPHDDVPSPIPVSQSVYVPHEVNREPSPTNAMDQTYNTDVSEGNIFSSSTSSSTSSSESDFDSDDSVKDVDYVPEQRKASPQILSSDSDDYIEYSQQRNVRISQTPEQNSDTEDNILNDQTAENQVQLTKKGSVRKRKHFASSLKERQTLKKQIKNETKYNVKPGCNENCNKKCTSNISASHRISINKTFRTMTWKEQTYFIQCNTSQKPPERRTTKNPNSSRQKTIQYYLSDENKKKNQVCKTFFLTTLGFNKSNDKAVRNALKSSEIAEPIDKRGTNRNPKKINNTTIIEHINSFNPSISHYRREHAPNRKYLPTEISKRDMYRDYCEKFATPNSSDQDHIVSYEHYRKVIKSLNISFAKLGNEECELCEIYKIHNPDLDIRHRKCTQCIEFEAHNRRKTLAREKYTEDKNIQVLNGPNSDSVYYSVDLEKVIMLPRMDTFKTVIFCPRLVVFNESFVPLGDKKQSASRETFACIWHEAIQGRKKEDIVSCFRAFLLHYRDMKHITLWLDNCAAQNKNWALYSFLLYLINSNQVNVETITLRYFEVGHTFMSADEFHHQVEKSMKRKKRLYDFKDFHRVVADTNRKIVVKDMEIGDFFTFEDCSSYYKLQNSSPRPYLNDMCEVKFERGSYIVTYRTDFEGEPLELDFLRVKNVKNGIPDPVLQITDRGIKRDRKDQIIEKLCPLMPENRKVFWHNLTVNDDALNLITEHEE